MVEIWLISDTHFFHENILNFDNPLGFRSLKERHEFMLDKWNSTVKRGDKVYHLGDVFMGPSEHQDRISLWHKLNGSKRLIVGNHDKVKYLSNNPFFANIMLWKRFDEHDLVLTHAPLHPSTLEEERWREREVLNVHGHTHSLGSPEGPYFSVCVEMTNYTPINIEEVRDSYRKNKM